MLTGEQIKEAKAQGFLRDKRSFDKFNARIITGNGRIAAQKHKIIAQAAEKFGDGYVMPTTRLSLEISGVAFENIRPLREFLQKAGLDTGGTGAKVRPVVSCKGTSCPFGLIDTFGLSREIHDRFYTGFRDIVLPHKFKIAVGGCPNNCVKPNLNDLGIVGQRILNPNFDKNDKSSKRYVNGYAVYIGGRWGRDINIGQKLKKVFLSKEEVLDFIEKVIMFFKDNGREKERFADTVKRIGFENVENALA